ncbi:SCO family protein [Spirosoma radiotolerans]|uniref:Electron transporter n=1 Tax=Spirosoma radiotolerans TaxID=1379870 RepID=A0A0E4A0J2_9BACT|nr:SCO family protein [Spirosoma radiotolerans]AKD58162.1 electron transporter [Spirosoma radiotolerans]
MWRTVFSGSSVVAIILLLIACGKETSPKLPYYNTPDFSPIFVESASELAEKIPHTISNFSFRDQNGVTISEKDIEGKIHVADFFFTSCGSICPRMTKHMKLVEKAFPANKNVVLLSYSVTPWIDSVSRLKAYSRANNIQSENWHLLTGSKAAIYQLARQSYFAEEELGFTKDSTEFLHTEHFLLVDKQKRIRGIYNGTLELEMQQLIADIQSLLKEN